MNNSGSYFSYDAPAPSYANSWLYAGIAVALGAVLVAVVYFMRKPTRSSHETTSSR